MVSSLFLLQIRIVLRMFRPASHSTSNADVLRLGCRTGISCLRQMDNISAFEQHLSTFGCFGEPKSVLNQVLEGIFRTCGHLLLFWLIQGLGGGGPYHMGLGGRLPPAPDPIYIYIYIYIYMYVAASCLLKGWKSPPQTNKLFQLM